MSRTARLAAVLGGALAAAAIAIVVYLVVRGGESAGIEAGVTLRDVVEHPARYEGRRVTVSGEWAENDAFAPEDADQVIVLGADADADADVRLPPGAPDRRTDPVDRASVRRLLRDPRAFLSVYGAQALEDGAGLEAGSPYLLLRTLRPTAG